MKLPKKTKKCFVSDIIGAVIISRDTQDNSATVVPAKCGIIKRHGCVNFHSVLCRGFALLLAMQDCQAVYFDWPNAGEAWLVVPYFWGYEWTRIDGEIEFS